MFAIYRTLASYSTRQPGSPIFFSSHHRAAIGVDRDSLLIFCVALGPVVMTAIAWVRHWVRHKVGSRFRQSRRKPQEPSLPWTPGARPPKDR